MSEQHKHAGPVRTDMHCHACSKAFIAELEHDIEGQHVIECPHCAHKHYRAIKDGVVTESRWGSDSDTHAVKCRRVWKHNSLAMKSSTASEFIRNRWLNFNA